MVLGLTQNQRRRKIQGNLEKPNNVNILKNLENKFAIWLPNGGYKRR
jgi:hypothetical protein